MKEERKEKIIKESQGVSCRHVSSANRKFRGPCVAPGSTLRYRGEGGGVGLPEVLATASAVPPARGAHTSGCRAEPPHPSPNGHTFADL